MPARPAAILFYALLTAACAAARNGAPSLAPRAAEAIDPRVPVTSSSPAIPADAALTGRLAELVARARQGDAAFETAAAEADRLAAGAGSPETESWVVAQQALSVAVAAREQTARAMADIDALAATRLAERGGIGPADLAAIKAAAGDVAALDQRQAERVERIQARLGA